MKRRVYVICQKREWHKGTIQAISDGIGQLRYVFASREGLKRAKQKVKTLNAKKYLQPVHLRKATLIIEDEIKLDASRDL